MSERVGEEWLINERERESERERVSERVGEEWLINE